MRKLSQQRGSTLIQVVLMMVVLIGFTALTTDYGILVLRQRQLQVAVDAAALSGAADLFGAGTVENAKEKALQTAASAGVPNVSVSADTSSTPYTLTVRSTDYVPTFFARALKSRYRTGRASALATASKNPAVSVSRLRPWGVPWAFFNQFGTGQVSFNEPATLSLSRIGEEDPNSLGPDQTYISPLALDGRPENEPSGYPRYAKYVREGYPKSISISGSMSATVIGQTGTLQSIAFATETALKTGSNSLFAQAGDAKYNNNDWQNPGDSPRVVFLPVIDQMLGGEALIEGFAAFYIEDVQYNQVKGRFIRYTLPYNTDQPGTLDPSFYTPGLTERPQLIK
ncbi:MAG TPA: pilus assembly protein TadG-related protein [Armatimonadota bacterium]